MTLPTVKHFVSGGYQRSVFRRTILLTSLMLPAFAANFLVYFFSGRMLAADQFGIFYVALTIGNVLFSGALILNIYFTRHLVRVVQEGGQNAALHATLRLERVVLGVGSLCASLTLVGLLAIQPYLGVQSHAVIVLIILDAFTAYIADLGRVLLQSLQRTVMLGLYTLVWMVLRLVLGIAGIWTFGTVWGGQVGIVASAIVMFAIFRAWLFMSTRSEAKAVPSLPSALGLLPAIAGYGFMITISNLDVLASYFLLSNADLGAYSASSVFPKAILVVITPMLQMLFPMMVTGSRVDRNFQLALAKIGGIVLGLSAGGAFMIWLWSDWLCGGTWGLKLCQAMPLRTLLISAIPLALLRALVMLQFARGRDLPMLWLAAPSAAYPYFSWTGGRSIQSVANAFAVYAGVTLMFYMVVSMTAEIVRRRAILRPR